MQTTFSVVGMTGSERCRWFANLQHPLFLAVQWTCRYAWLKTCAGSADGIKEQGSGIMYRANVREILTEGEGDKLKAVGVQLADDSVFHGQVDSVVLLCLPMFCKSSLVL